VHQRNDVALVATGGGRCGWTHRLSSAQSQLLLYFLYSPGTYLHINEGSWRRSKPQQHQNSLLDTHNRLIGNVQALEQKCLKKLHSLRRLRDAFVVDVSHLPSNELEASVEIRNRIQLASGCASAAAGVTGGRCGGGPASSRRARIDLH
jgi:hypothetical protein